MITPRDKALEPGELPPELAGALLELASEAIVLIDSEMKILGVNRQTCTLLGYTKAELVGRELPSLILPEYRESVLACQSALDRGETSRGQQGMHRKDGSSVMVEFSARKLPDGSTLGIVRDVSERVLAEAEIRRHKEFVEELLDSSADGIVAMDTETRVMVFNPALERITGVKADQVLGRNAYEVFPFLIEVGEDVLVNTALQGQATEARDKTFTVPTTGRVGSYEARYSPLRDGAGTITGVIGIIRDVTERHELEQRLLRAQKMETAGRLAGGIAHDFNNMLTVILGEVALTLGRRWSEDNAREALRRIGDAAERAASITRQLLAFSRRSFASPSTFTLRELVHEMSPMLRHLVGESIRLDVEEDPSAGPVRADRGHLEQILANLVVNARDAMPIGGRLTIRTYLQHLEPSSEWRIGSFSPGPYAVLSVTDTGVGMNEQVKSKLFEPFFTTKKNGTGLGLCSCLGLLQGNAGDISIESEPGKGTTVRICLPQCAPLSETVSGNGLPDAEHDLPGGSERILLVEDEAGVRAVTAQMLRSLGYQLYEAENGVAALEFLEQFETPVDLVLSDVVMPRMGGRELMERIRSRYRDVRVLLMTGYTEDSALRQRIESEELPILEKPFTENALAIKVRAVLDRPSGE